MLTLGDRPKQCNTFLPELGYIKGVTLVATKSREAEAESQHMTTVSFPIHAQPVLTKA